MDLDEILSEFLEVGLWDTAVPVVLDLYSTSIVTRGAIYSDKYEYMHRTRLCAHARARASAAAVAVAEPVGWVLTPAEGAVFARERGVLTNAARRSRTHSAPKAATNGAPTTADATAYSRAGGTDAPAANGGAIAAVPGHGRSCGDEHFGPGCRRRGG